MSYKPTGRDTDYTQTSAEAGHDDLDSIFKILANERRRHVLYCLQEYDRPIALSDLADEVAVREHDSRITEIPAEEVKQIYISLYHIHVPRMEETGLVDYDQDTDLVAFREEGEELLEAHDLIQ